MESTLTPTVGDYLQIDSWGHGGQLLPGEPYVDAGFPGCQFRVEGGHCSPCVDITITGKRAYRHNGNCLRVRVRVEFIGDCEASQFSGGWLILLPEYMKA